MHTRKLIGKDKFRWPKCDDEVNISDLKLQLQISEEKHKQLISAKFQSQRNTVVLDMPTLFDDCENEARKIETLENEEQITIGEHKRKRVVKEKHIDYSSLEHVVETIDIPSGEDVCEVCGSKVNIKKYDEKKELVYIPSKVFDRVTRIPVLECVNCQQVNEEGKSNYHVVSHRKPIFSRSIVSPELMAYIIDMKYNNGLPYMVNWVIGTMMYFQPLFNLMKEDLLKGISIHTDETRTWIVNTF